MQEHDFRKSDFEPLTPEEEAAIYKRSRETFDPVAAEKECLEILEKGGVSEEDLWREIERIDSQVPPRSA